MQEEIPFGVWLRKQRQALDLTRQALAEQVGCAEVTLRRIEGGTLKPSKELADILLANLNIPESERSQWTSYARGLSSFPTSSRPSSNKSKSNLPAPLTTFIGRGKEQAVVIRLVTKHRLITLTGSGGVGKTRLSLKIGEQLLGDFPDGVWLVELAPILDPMLVPRTTALAVGLRDEPQRSVIDMLSDYLHEKEMLIILDNCEHLLDACAQLTNALLKRCPSLKILATSREVLGILGESVYHVPSLELPDIQLLVEKLGEYESVRLFEERAQLARMDFLLTIENAPSVAKICKGLDGIPLAIELAAARVGTFSIEQIQERLQESLVLLNIGNRTAVPRHQTLQAAIDWSYDLLSLAEQTLFRRLSVFVNGWTLDAAESVCSDANIQSEMVLDLLGHLINKSLVIMEEVQPGTRYRILETIRQYAYEKLIESGERDGICDRHLEYFFGLTQTAEPYLIRTEQIEWLPVLDADYENLRLAFEWSLSKETAESSLHICKSLGWFWKIRGFWMEGLNWVRRALNKPIHDEIQNEKIARVQALYTCAQLEWQLGNFEQMLPPAQASLRLAQEVSGERDIAIARFYVGVALMRRGEDNQALTLLQQSLAGFEELNEVSWQAIAFVELGLALVRQEKLKLHEVYPRCLELARQAGERWILSNALTTYANWLFRIGRVDEALQYAEESNELYEQLGADIANTNSLLFADIAWYRGDTQKARSLYMELEQRISLLGEKISRTICIGRLGLLAMEEGDLDRAQIYLQKALTLEREAGAQPGVIFYLLELGNLSYLQGNFAAFKQNYREGLSLKNHVAEFHTTHILMTMLGSLYPQQPERTAKLLGVIENHESEFDLGRTSVQKRYYRRAEEHAQDVLGDAAFMAAFAAGKKMSLDEGLDLALKTVEEM